MVLKITQSVYEENRLADPSRIVIVVISLFHSRRDVRKIVADRNRITVREPAISRVLAPRRSLACFLRPSG